MTELACLAHCRRKFFDLHAAGGHPVAAEVLRRIAELYAVEVQARDGDVAARLALRQQHAMPKLSALRDWLIAQRVKTADGTGLARAIDYSLKRWPALMRYVDNGALPIDNNPAHAASGMSWVMPTPGLCRVPWCEDTRCRTAGGSRFRSNQLVGIIKGPQGRRATGREA